MLVGALSEAVMMIADSDDPAGRRERRTPTLLATAGGAC